MKEEHGSTAQTLFRNFKTRSSGFRPGPGLESIALGMQVPNITVPSQWDAGCQLRSLDF